MIIVWFLMFGYSWHFNMFPVTRDSFDITFIDTLIICLVDFRCFIFIHFHFIVNRIIEIIIIKFD